MGISGVYCEGDIVSVKEDIQIPNIEAELGRFWKKQAEQHHVHACLFNVIAYSQEKAHADYLHEVIQAIVDKFPCRILFVQGDPSPSQNYLRAKVTDPILGKGNAEGIACEQILIETSTSQLQRVPFIILPNLVPDLPIYFLWGTDPTIENPILTEMSKYATRLIFDSCNADNLLQFSRRILKFLESKPKLVLMDITWVLTSGWRHILSQVFESPEARQHLNANMGIQIRYNSKKGEWVKHTDIQAFYLAGWLASQLQWKFLKHELIKEERHLTFSNGNNEFIISLVPEKRDNLHPSAIVGIDVASRNDHLYSILPMPNLPKAVVHISTLETCALPFTISLPSLKRGCPYTQELIYSPPSSHYQMMLQTISQFSE